jgi:hypothetical protein
MFLPLLGFVPFLVKDKFFVRFSRLLAKIRVHVYLSIQVSQTSLKIFEILVQLFVYNSIYLRVFLNRFFD